MRGVYSRQVEFTSPLEFQPEDLKLAPVVSSPALLRDGKDRDSGIFFVVMFWVTLALLAAGPSVERKEPAAPRAVPARVYAVVG